MTTKTILFLFLAVTLTELNVYGQNAKTQSASKTQSATTKINFSTENEGDKNTNVFFSKNGIQAIDIASNAEFVSKKIKVPIENPEPFLSLAAVWEADNYVDGNISVQYRTSADGENWNEWDIFKQDEHSESDDEHVESNKHISSLIFLDKNIKYIQYSALFQKGGNVVLKSLRLDFFSPGYISDSEIAQKKEELIQGSQQSAVACPCPALSYVSRTGWNCPVGSGSNCSLQQTTVTNFVLHHQAAPANPPYSSVVLSIYNYHVNTNGWCDVGYNWLIAPDGTLYQGRGWIGGNDNTVGGHMCACNGNKMGICLLGDYTSVTPSTATYNKLIELLAWKSCSFSINPTGTATTTVKTCCPNTNCSCSSSSVNTIIGHRTGCASCTSCPGNSFFAQIPTVRTDVQSYINSCGGTTTVANDNCADATTLTSNASCVNTAGDVSAATASGVAQPSCDAFASPALSDVWYKFTATSTSHTITITPSASFDAVVALYTSCSGGEIGCADSGGGSGVAETINATSLTIGSTYYIRVYDYGSVAPTTTTFDICVTHCTVADPVSVSGGGAFCNSATLTASGGSGGTIYWQNTTSGGTSTATTSSSQTVTSSGTYYFRASNTCGWGTEGSATVTINTVDTSITKNEFTLTSNATPATYQWITCPAMQLVSGETNQSYSPSQNGNYAVIVTQNGCTDTSNCYQVSVTGLSFTSNATSIIVYPNPTNNLLTVKGIGLDNDTYKIKLTNSVGQLLNEKEININNKSIETQFDLIEYSSATYFLTISSKTINHIFKIQKQ